MLGPTFRMCRRLRHLLAQITTSAQLSDMFPWTSAHSYIHVIQLVEGVVACGQVLIRVHNSLRHLSRDVRVDHLLKLVMLHDKKFLLESGVPFLNSKILFVELIEPVMEELFPAEFILWAVFAHSLLLALIIKAFVDGF